MSPLILSVLLIVAPKAILASNTMMVEENQNVTIACNATGQPQPSVTWFKALSSLPKSRTRLTNKRLIIFNVKKKDRGTYICKADNILGSAMDNIQLMHYFLSSAVQNPSSSRIDSCYWLYYPSTLRGRK